MTEQKKLIRILTDALLKYLKNKSQNSQKGLDIVQIPSIHCDEVKDKKGALKNDRTKKAD